MIQRKTVVAEINCGIIVLYPITAKNHGTNQIRSDINIGIGDEMINLNLKLNYAEKRKKTAISGMSIS